MMVEHRMCTNPDTLAHFACAACIYCFQPGSSVPCTAFVDSRHEFALKPTVGVSYYTVRRTHIGTHTSSVSLNHA